MITAKSRVLVQTDIYQKEWTFLYILLFIQYGSIYQKNQIKSSCI